MRGFISIFLIVLFSFIPADGVDLPQSLKARFGDRTLLPIEGVWMWNSGAMVSIEASGSRRIILTLVDSPDPLMDTPQVVGYGQFGGKENTYNIELETSKSLNEGQKGTQKLKFIAKINDAGRLTLTPYSTRLKVNVWRMIPYLFRYSLSRDKKPA